MSFSRSLACARTHSLKLSALVLIARLAGAPGAQAQEPIKSSAALKRACETGTHHVYVTADIQIIGGPHQSVASGCKVSLGPSADFAVDDASMSFAGRFEVYASRGRSVSFSDSAWRASSLGIYGGSAGTLRSTASLLQARVGDIAIAGGSSDTIEIQQRPAGSVNALKAAGSVFIGGGEKLSLALTDTGIEGMRGVRIILAGGESKLIAEGSELRSPRGPLGISSAGSKTNAELHDVTLASGGNTSVSLGSESTFKAVSSRISSQASVNLRAGSQSARFGGVELVESTVSAAGELRVEGSAGSDRGTVKVGGSALTAGSDVQLRTGALGQTEVKGTSIATPTAIRILTGPGGTCAAESNTYQAPVRRICP